MQFFSVGNIDIPDSASDNLDGIGNVVLSISKAAISVIGNELHALTMLQYKSNFGNGGA